MDAIRIAIAREREMVSRGQPIGVELAEAVERTFVDHGLPLSGQCGAPAKPRKAQA
jgi:hypothetical protein